MDAAEKWTNAELKKLEKKIKQEYTKAYRECRDEMSKVMMRIQAHPEWTTEKVMLEMSKYDRLENLSNQMASVLQDTTKTAINFMEKSSVNVFKMNYNMNAEQLGFSVLDNTAVKNIMTGNVNPFTKLAIAGEEDKGVIMRKLESELTTSLLRGESIPQMARRIKTTAEGLLKNTIRIARTETTRVQNSARQSVAEEGHRLGFNMWKRWVATADERTRDAHANAEGQEVPYSEPFIIDGEQLMYPGDISMGASASNVVNCRCTIVTFIKE